MEIVLLQAFGGGYYKGGFDPKMTKREAALVLGVRCVLHLTIILTVVASL